MSDILRNAQLGALEHLPLPVQIWRLEGLDALRIVAANQASERILGVGTQAAGAAVEDAFPALRGTGVLSMCASVARSGEPASMAEVKVAGPEGAAARMTVKAFPLGEGHVGLAFEDVSALAEAREQLRRTRALYSTVLDCVTDLVFVKAAKDHTYLLVNKACGEFAQETAASIVGMRNRDFLPEDVARALEETDDKILAGRERVSFEETLPWMEGFKTSLTMKTPIYDEVGQPIGVVGITRDITEAKRNEEALRQSLKELERARAVLLETIRQLLTPVLPIHDGILVMPLVGELTRDRSDQFSDALLTGIQRHRAHTVIIDITAVGGVVDASVASHLIDAGRAASLLGTECVLVGMTPLVAMSLTRMGADLGSIVTRSDLQAGVAYALARRASAHPSRR